MIFALLADLLERTANQGIDESDSRMTMKKGIANDRVVQATDPDIRHGRKTFSVETSGLKTHTTTDANLATSVVMTAANNPDAEPLPEVLEQCKADRARPDRLIWPALEDTWMVLHRLQGLSWHTRVESCTIHMRTISLVPLRTAHHNSRSSSVYAMDSLVSVQRKHSVARMSQELAELEDGRLTGMSCCRSRLVLVVGVTVAAALIGGVHAHGQRLVLDAEARAIVEANRPAGPEMHDRDMLSILSKLQYRYEDFSDEPTCDESAWGLSSDDESPSVISIEHAICEVDLIFRVIKYGYAGYQYFGGDVSFGNAKREILQELGVWQTHIPVGEYESILTSQLGFIQDGHFGLGTTQLCSPFTLSWNPQYEFRRDEAGFQSISCNRVRRVVSIEGGDPFAYLKPSISVDGSIVYVPGVMRRLQDSGVSIDVEYEDGQTETIRLNPMTSIPLRGPAYELSEMDATPTVAIRTFAPTLSVVEDLAAFIDDAGSLRDKKAIMLDLRSNGGGLSTYPISWLWRLTYEDPKPCRLGIQLVTGTAAFLVNPLFQLFSGSSQMPSDAGEFLRTQSNPAFPGWGYMSHGARSVMKNEPLIVVITDGYVASAAEHFVASLRHMDNVVFIGANTSGTLLTGCAGTCLLPFSGLAMAVPTGLSLLEDASNRDGVGFLPDFWVHPDCALERATRFIRKHVVVELRSIRSGVPTSTTSSEPSLPLLRSRTRHYPISRAQGSPRSHV